MAARQRHHRHWASAAMASSKRRPASPATSAAPPATSCSHQMPELYSGMQRDPTNFPVQYLGANVPQAWAAGSCFAMLQMIVGFQPDAPAGKLYIDPALPEWLPELTIRDLQVGENVFDLRFLARRRRYAVRDPEGRSAAPSSRRATPRPPRDGCSARATKPRHRFIGDR